MDFALGFDLLDLPGDLAVVDRGVLDGPDYSQGDGVVGVLHRRQHRVERRVALVGVVRQHVVQRVAVLTDGYDLQLHVLEDDAFLLVGSEQHLLAVAQRYGALRTRSLVGGELAVGLVVEYHAVLQYFDYRHAFVHRGGHHALLRKSHLHVHRPGEERALGADHQFAGVERLLDRAVRRGLGDLAQLRSGGVLAFGQTVNLVVEQNDVEVHVAADGVDEVVAADGQRVAVAGGDPHREARVGRLDARRHGVCAAVYGVEPVGFHVVDEARRASDARHEREHVVRRVCGVGYFGQRALHGVEDGVVAASGAPAYLLIAFEIRWGVFVFCHGVTSIRIRIFLSVLRS